MLQLVLGAHPMGQRRRARRQQDSPLSHGPSYERSGTKREERGEKREGKREVVWRRERNKVDEEGRRHVEKEVVEDVMVSPGKQQEGRRETKNHPAVPVPHTNRRTCLLDNKTLCTLNRVQRDTVATQGRARFRQFMLAVALRKHSKPVSSHVHNVSSN